MQVQSYPITQCEGFVGARAAPCHFYHTASCTLEQCRFSHEGAPVGMCLNSSCPICARAQQASQQTYYSASLNWANRRPLRRRAIVAQLPPKDDVQQKFIETTVRKDSSASSNSSSSSSSVEAEQLKLQQCSQASAWFCRVCKQVNPSAVRICRQCQHLRIQQLQLRKSICQQQQFNSETIPQYILETNNIYQIVQDTDKHHEQLEEAETLDYLFVIDFECTCEEGDTQHVMEIIEFPIIVVDVKRAQIVNTFHSFVRPTIQPKLSEFCTKLTGITQAQVDKANTLEYVLKAVDFFLRPYTTQKQAEVLNDCSSDMRRFLLREAHLKGLTLSQHFQHFINLKKVFPQIENQNKRPRSLQAMLSNLNLSFVGRRHSGLADAKNLARVAIELIKRSYHFTAALAEPVALQAHHAFRYLVVLHLTFVAGKQQKDLSELAAVIVDLHKNQLLWSSLTHQHFSKDQDCNSAENTHFQDQNFQAALATLQQLTHQAPLRRENFAFVSLYPSTLDLLHTQAQKYPDIAPAFLKAKNLAMCHLPPLKEILTRTFNFRGSDGEENSTISVQEGEKFEQNIFEYLSEGLDKQIWRQQSDVITAVRQLNTQGTTTSERAKNSALAHAIDVAQMLRMLVVKGYIFDETVFKQ